MEQNQRAASRQQPLAPATEIHTQAIQMDIRMRRAHARAANTRESRAITVTRSRIICIIHFRIVEHPYIRPERWLLQQLLTRLVHPRARRS